MTSFSNKSLPFPKINKLIYFSDPEDEKEFTAFFNSKLSFEDKLKYRTTWYARVINYFGCLFKGHSWVVGKVFVSADKEVTTIKNFHKLTPHCSRCGKIQKDGNSKKS